MRVQEGYTGRGNPESVNVKKSGPSECKNKSRVDKPSLGGCDKGTAF